jgi:hypothetical protein
MVKDELQPELSDIIEMIHRYCSSNKNEVSFVWSFVGFKEDPEHKCVECGDNCDIVDDKKSMVGAYGDLETLRILTNELRDVIEDEVDEDGFINL